MLSRIIADIKILLVKISQQYAALAGYVNSNPSLILLLVFLVIIFSVGSYTLFPTQTLVILFTTLMQVNAGFIALLITSAIFMTTLGKDLWSHESKLRKEIEEQLYANRELFKVARESIQEKLNTADSEDYKSLLRGKFVNALSLEAVSLSESEIERIITAAAQQGSISVSQIQSNASSHRTWLHSIEYAVKPILEYCSDLSNLLFQIGLMKKDQDGGVYIDKYSLERFVGPRLIRVILALFTSFVALGIGLFILETNLVVTLPAFKISVLTVASVKVDLIKLTIGIILDYSFLSLMLLLRYVVLLVKSFRRSGSAY